VPDKQKWVSEHLSHWNNFSREPIDCIDCEGNHADMLNPQYIQGFEQRLNRVLEARGL
jgi:thioesterase domain-containing protein